MCPVPVFWVVCELSTFKERGGGEEEASRAEMTCEEKNCWKTFTNIWHCNALAMQQNGRHPERKIKNAFLDRIGTNEPRIEHKWREVNRRNGGRRRRPGQI